MQTEETKEKGKVKKYEAKEIKAEIKQERVKYQREKKYNSKIPFMRKLVQLCLKQ